MITAHAILYGVVLLVLAWIVYLSFRLGSGRERGGRLSDPLDGELVRRWNAASGAR